MRGNRSRVRRASPGRGPTPARAGQPGICDRVDEGIGAYPRACGATHHATPGLDARAGLPPRVRGNPTDPGCARGRGGPTPARAGQPVSCRTRRSPRTAYPRACGATTFLGLIGHARGGPTPARAGQPASPMTTAICARAYPRACGATSPHRTERCVVTTGLPPRVRGNPRGPGHAATCKGPTPARAGQPPADRPGGHGSAAYPRACGATRDLVQGRAVERRPTPARAGQPCRSGSRLRPLDGLPPRVRGNPRLPGSASPRSRPTPARAGQPLSADRSPSCMHGLPPRVRGNPGHRCALPRE